MILAYEKKFMSEIYIEYPQKMYLFVGPHQHKKPTFLHIKRDLPNIFLE